MMTAEMALTKKTAVRQKFLDVLMQLLLSIEL